MSYATRDRAAAMRDLAAIEGEFISVAGRMIQAHFELGSGSQSASDFGADERIETARASFEWDGPGITFTDEIRARGKTWRITELDVSAAPLIALELENDR